MSLGVDHCAVDVLVVSDKAACTLHGGCNAL